ncbi:MAG: rRNA maturation RNase YbeY [Gammaproteobacteria bacterium]|nr:rRNA maturation RNase YbeY [Gammaproteobacteria bacterium]
MSVFVADEQDEPIEAEPLRRLAAMVLEEEGLPHQADLTLMLVDLDQMTEYNERFMERGEPTDVLAFPLEHLSPGEYPDPGPGDPPLNLGDVVIAPEYVRRQAGEMGVSFEDELALMVVHGILHLLGYDHTNDEDAERMEARERALLKKDGRRRP